MLAESRSHSGVQPEDEILEKANMFLDALLPLPTQRDLTPGNEYALFSFDHGNRKVFDYFAPSARFYRGLPLRYMNPIQRKAADELLKVSLSQRGLEKVNLIRSLEDVLAAIEEPKPDDPPNPRHIIRDSKAYYITIFGTLSPQGRLPENSDWGWRYEGHHLSLHWTFSNGFMISSTPQFIGAQPAIVAHKVEGGPEPGTRVLGQEEDLARDLIGMLTKEQQRVARSEVPWDIETTNVKDPRYERRPHRLEDRGIAYSALTEDQKKKLQELVREHASVQLEKIAQDRIERIEKTGWDRVKFFLMGGYERGDALYYRIRALDTFLIEYINKAFTAPQLDANHQHTVWRDLNNGDWGDNSLNSPSN